ncbi:MAG: ferredoxin thioredoxin reductase [Desulfobulbaceae bacterium BRH_c16a]|nr:MAG: ferredoxin thioredoxin reductase [Desulfobulbaceae bacterium BRH_c16a]
MTREEQLYANLKKSQEKLGYCFNNDLPLTMDLIRGLLANRERYGYMSCPCRLASGVVANDRDIVCPCHYRAADISEYGSCYCGLYVSHDWNDGAADHVYVPERRPAEKII